MPRTRDERAEREPWVGLESRPRRKRASLDRDKIVTAAVRIIDAEGAAALSMRRLGVELGSGATSVYRHVRDKDELIDLAFDAITGEIALPEPGAAWEDALVASARGVRDLFHRHRNFVLVIGHRASLGPHTLALLEGLLGILRGAGFADQTAYHAISAIANYATGFAVLEIVPGLRGAGDAGNPEYRELISANVGSLPLHLYPNLAAVAPVMVGKEDDDFAYGVRAIVTGIRSQRPDTASGSARARAVE